MFETHSQGLLPFHTPVPELVVADANNQQTIFFPQPRQISKAANHRNAADFSAHSLSIIHKGTVVLEHRLLRYHAPEATGTNQQQFFS